MPRKFKCSKSSWKEWRLFSVRADIEEDFKTRGFSRKLLNASSSWVYSPWKIIGCMLKRESRWGGTSVRRSLSGGDRVGRDAGSRDTRLPIGREFRTMHERGVDVSAQNISVQRTQRWEMTNFACRCVIKLQPTWPNVPMIGNLRLIRRKGFTLHEGSGFLFTLGHSRPRTTIDWLSKRIIHGDINKRL